MFSPTRSFSDSLGEVLRGTVATHMPCWLWPVSPQPGRLALRHRAPGRSRPVGRFQRRLEGDGSAVLDGRLVALHDVLPLELRVASGRVGVLPDLHRQRHLGFGGESPLDDGVRAGVGRGGQVLALQTQTSIVLFTVPELRVLQTLPFAISRGSARRLAWSSDGALLAALSEEAIFVSDLESGES